MKWWILVVGWLFIGGIHAQEMRINEREVTKESAQEFLEKGKSHSNTDSAEFYFNKSLLISQELGYWEGEMAASEALLNLHDKDKVLYDKIRYGLLYANVVEKHGSKSDKVQIYCRLGAYYYNDGLFSKATEQYKKAVAIDGEGKEGSFEPQIGLVRAYRRSSNLDDALVAARKLEYSPNLKLQQKVDLYREKAEIYHALKAYPEEEASYREILSQVSGTSLAYLTPTLWNNIGYTNKYSGDSQQAKSAFLKVVKTADKSDVALLGTAYQNIGLLLYNERDLDSSILSFQKANSYYATCKAYDLTVQSMNMEALAYYQKNDQFNAQKRIDAAIKEAEKHKLARELSRAYEIKSMIHQELFEYELALSAYKKHLSIRDSLLTEERVNESKSLFEQYRLEQLEKQLRLIWAKTELDVQNLARERAEKEAERERFNAKTKADQLRIAELQNKELNALRELQRLQLIEERLNLENTAKQLSLAEKENRLKELALDKERLVIAANKKEIDFLAQKSELEKQKRLNEQAAYAYRTKLFIGGFLGIFLILLGILYAYRKLQQRKKKIEQQSLIIAESKRQIELEKEKSEGLLLNILPAAIAEELKANGSSKPKLYDEVSVGFTDFSGFTMISEKLTPEQLVHKLDEMFLSFDLIIERYGLQRIKTIGDAYMFAGGVPETMEDHAIRTVKAALEMRDFISDYNAKLSPSEPKWNIRIGVNTGQIVAGVIGIKKFAYDIWGDAVNIAARMESSGEVGKVNVSGSTFLHVAESFNCEYRGKVEAKNKGAIDMYFVEN